MKVMLLGATGLTGGLVLRGLLEAAEVTAVVAPVRSSLALTHPKLSAPTVDFEALSRQPEWFAVDAVICCLGTTIRKAGSQAAFRRVDLDYPLAAAKLARAAGARHFLLMSAMGARSDSRFFYNRVKAQLEDALRSLGFDSLIIYQPGLLLGERDEFRLGEAMAGRLLPILNTALAGPLSPYKAIHAQTVARAILQDTRQLTRNQQPRPVVVIRRHDDMVALASRTD
jgi:uncharacterized protein YbjT (DUF2867 family)